MPMHLPFGDEARSCGNEISGPLQTCRLAAQPVQRTGKYTVQYSCTTFPANFVWASSSAAGLRQAG